MAETKTLQRLEDLIAALNIEPRDILFAATYGRKKLVVEFLDGHKASFIIDCPDANKKFKQRKFPCKHLYDSLK